MSDCPFCPIPANAKIVRKWEPGEVRLIGGVVAFEPLNPVTPGHLLVVPQKHYTDSGISPYVTGVVMSCAAELAQELESCNIITSKGAAATQSVMHLHVHVVPRVENDGLHLPWTGQLT